MSNADPEEPIMVDFSRRTFALGLSTAAALTAGVLPPAAGTAKTNPRVKSVPATPLAQLRIGRFTVTALTDGFTDMPFGYFPGRTAQEIKAAARAQFAAQPSGIRFLFNQYLIENGEHRILIDTGPGGSLGQSGQLPQALAATGLNRDQIDAVIVTHMHQDHIGGLVAGGKANFSRAELYIDRRDVAHWSSLCGNALIC
jgi:hypothetical protein